MAIIKFDIEKVELLKELSDDQIALLKVHVCHDKNNRHNMPISLDTIKRAAEASLRGKPILYEYVASKDDFGTHSPSQIPAGYFIENQEFEYVEQNEKTYLVALAVMWKRYAQKAYEIFVDDNYRPVSMEVELVEVKKNEDNQYEIVDMVFQGVTILGTDVLEACEGSNVTVIKFSEEVEKTEKILAEFSSQNNEENLNISNDNDTQEKEVELMSFNKAEFAEKFSMTANDMMELMREACGQKKYQSGDYEYTKYWMIDYDENYMYAYDEEDGGKVAIPYSMEDGKPMPDYENVKPAMTKTQWVILEEKETEEFDVMMEMANIFMKMANEKQDGEDNQKNMSTNDQNDNDNKEFSTENQNDNANQENKEEFSAEGDDIKKELEDLKAEFASMKTEYAQMKEENEQLKKFKSDVEEKEKLEKIEFALSSVSDYVPQEKIDEMRSKVDEFATIDAWQNYVKAEAFEFAKNIKKEEDGIKRFALPYPNDKQENEKSRSIWSRL